MLIDISRLASGNSIGNDIAINKKWKTKFTQILSINNTKQIRNIKITMLKTIYLFNKECTLII